jgi:hypothetical protein
MCHIRARNELAGWVMGSVVSLKLQRHVPSVADHVALRTLIKYMSSVLGIGYKTIAAETRFDESSVKNYTNDKSIRNSVSRELYVDFSARCAQLLSERRESLSVDPYIAQILVHIFGDEWLSAVGVSVPVQARDGEEIGLALKKWSGAPDELTAQVQQRYCGSWKVVRLSKKSPSSRWVDYSLLDITPAATSGGLCGFRWYCLGRGREIEEHTLSEGFIVPAADRIHFFGKTSFGAGALAMMVWRFTPNAALGAHARVADGILLANEAGYEPVAARIRSFFLGSAMQVEGAALDREFGFLGVHPFESLRANIPENQYEKTLGYLEAYEPVMGFLPSGE